MENYEIFSLVLEYGEACNQTRECNERKNLFCSEPNKKCYCDSKNKNTYSYGKECFSRKFFFNLI